MLYCLRLHWPSGNQCAFCISPLSHANVHTARHKRVFGNSSQKKVDFCSVKSTVYVKCSQKNTKTQLEEETVKTRACY